MRIAQLRSLPWRLWWTQLRAILRIEWKKNFLSRRSWWIYLAALAPVILTAGHSLVAFYRGGANHTLAQDSRVFAGVFQLGYLRMFLFFGCAILFTNLFRGEVLNRTLHYYFLVPLRREVLAAGKYFSGLIAATVLYAGSVVLAYVMMFLHFGPQFEEFFYEGPGMAHLVSYAGVTVLACIGYGAVFTVMGLVFRNGGGDGVGSGQRFPSASAEEGERHLLFEIAVPGGCSRAGSGGVVAGAGSRPRPGLARDPRAPPGVRAGDGLRGLSDSRD